MSDNTQVRPIIFQEDRFITEFAGDILATVPIKPGDVLVVKSVYLAEELNDVFAFAKVVKAQDHSQEFTIELGQGSYYDAERDHADLAEELAKLLGKAVSTIRKRFNKAKL